MEVNKKKIMRMSNFNLSYQSRKTGNAKKTVGISKKLTSVFEFACAELGCSPSFVRSELIKESVLADNSYHSFSCPKTQFLNKLYSYHENQDPCIKVIEGTEVHLSEMNLDETVKFYDFCHDNGIKEIKSIVEISIEGVNYKCIRANQCDVPDVEIHNGETILFTGYLSDDLNTIAMNAWIHHAISGAATSDKVNPSDKVLDTSLSFNSEEYYFLYEQGSSEPFASLSEVAEPKLISKLISGFEVLNIEIDVVFVKNESQYVLNSSNPPLWTGVEQLQWDDYINVDDTLAIFSVDERTATVFSKPNNIAFNTDVDRASLKSAHLFDKTREEPGMMGDIIQLFYSISLESDNSSAEFKRLQVEATIKPRYCTKGIRQKRHQYNHLDIDLKIFTDNDFSEFQSEEIKEILVKNCINFIIFPIYLSNSLPMTTITIGLDNDNNGTVNLPFSIEDDEVVKYSGSDLSTVYIKNIDSIKVE